MSGANALVERLDGLLPQTQCGQCGHAGCRSYAESLAAGQAATDRCPPGGHDTAVALAAALGLAGAGLPSAAPPTVVVIDPATCIGCARCLGACPVDAIVGAPGFLHAVLAAECTGCNLCIPPCPVDCIAIVATAGPLALDGAARQRRAARYRAHCERPARSGPGRTPRLEVDTPEQRRAYVQAAVRLVRARGGRGGKPPDDDG